eukprot:6084607-Lingulodinium_polyedra.AAC.1
MDLGSYFNRWKSSSGVAPGLGPCVEMRNLPEMLRLAATYDQLNLLNVASLELAARRLLQIQ